MRTFVAVETGEGVRRALARVQDVLGRTGAKVRWVAPENMHLTLKFLGEIDEEQAELLRAELRTAATHHAPFDLEFAGVGTFPPRGAPRAIWAGCRGMLDRLQSLAAEVERCAEQILIPKEARSYSPHLTIGRAKIPPQARVVIPKLAEFEGRSFGTKRVESFVLFQSTLTSKGPVYSPLEEFGLSVP